jgi:hypothetical protein
MATDPRYLVDLLKGDNGMQTQAAIGGLGDQIVAAQQRKAAADLAQQKLAQEEELKRMTLAQAQAQQQANQEARLQALAQQKEIALGNQALQTDSLDIKRQLANQKAAGSQGYTPAEKAVDMKFGADYNDFVAQGGYSTVQKQLKQANGVLSDLKSGKVMTGPVVGTGPDFVRKRLTPKSFSGQQSLEEAVQGTMRTTLGAQFTEKEGSQILARAFDPALPPEENIRKTTNLLAQLDGIAKAKQAAASYYEQNGTLKGFKGNLPDISSLGSDPAPEAAGGFKIIGRRPK